MKARRQRRLDAAKLGLLGCAYFSQGLPFGFFTQALPVLLRQRGFSLGADRALLAARRALGAQVPVGAAGGPLSRAARRAAQVVDRAAPARAVASCALLAPSAAARCRCSSAVLLLNLIAATQDIATDGLAVDMLAPGERGFANGLQVAGYRVGMIMGGGAAHPSRSARMRRGVSGHGRADRARDAAASPRASQRARRTAPSAAVAHFLRRPGAARLLLLLVTYKIGDAFATGMLRPFLADGASPSRTSAGCSAPWDSSPACSAR